MGESGLIPALIILVVLGTILEVLSWIVRCFFHPPGFTQADASGFVMVTVAIAYTIYWAVDHTRTFILWRIRIWRIRQKIKSGSQE